MANRARYMFEGKLLSARDLTISPTHLLIHFLSEAENLCSKGELLLICNCGTETPLLILRPSLPESPKLDRGDY